MVVTMKMKTDLLHQTEYPVMMAPQNDGGCRMLEVSVYAGQEPWIVPEGACIRIHYCNPDGTGGSYDSLEDGSRAWSVSGNTVTITLVPQMFTQTGMVAAKIEFLMDGDSLQTFGFWIRVAADYTGNGVEPEGYFNWSAWTNQELERLLNEAKSSGDFRGEQGYSPVRGTDYWTEEDLSQMAGQISREVADQMADRAQLMPEFADRIEDCTDSSRLYVLPDGYIYAYQYTETAGPAYTNLAGAVLENTRMNSSGAAKELAGAVTTGFIPVKQGQVVRIKGFDPTVIPDSNYPYFHFYTAADESTADTTQTATRGDWLLAGGALVQNGDVYEYTAFKTGGDGSIADHPNSASFNYLRICGTPIDGAEIIVTVDEEITEGASEGGYAWSNTGHKFIQDARKWTGKKWVAVGDSLTYDEYVTTTAYYHDHIADDTGITVVNMGQGGTGYKRTFDTGEGYAFFQRILNVPTDADVITIFGSGNDLSTTWETYGLGDVTDTGTDTICGCINTTLDNLFSVFPTANVGVITPTPWKAFYPSATEADGKAYRMTQLCEKLVEICRMRSIPCLDLYHGSGLRPWDKAFRDAVYTRDAVESDGELGGVHLDENGHKIIAARIKRFLELLLF